MKVLLALLATALFLGSLCDAQGDSGFVKQYLPGHWQEDQYQRENLKNFLYQMGMSWIKRTYVAGTSWENRQNIAFDGSNTVNINGFKGPYSTEFGFKLVLDNRTRTEVDLGELGGLTDARAEIRGKSLITYIYKKDTEDHFLTATRTIDPEAPDQMMFESRHLPSNTAMVSHFNRATN